MLICHLFSRRAQTIEYHRVVGELGESPVRGWVSLLIGTDAPLKGNRLRTIYAIAQGNLVWAAGAEGRRWLTRITVNVP